MIPIKVLVNEEDWDYLIESKHLLEGGKPIKGDDYSGPIIYKSTFQKKGTFCLYGAGGMAIFYIPNDEETV